MPRSTQIGIDNPCHENWDQMTPAEHGRFCASCQKSVVDFTQMSDQQILQWLARNAPAADRRQHTCGRFHADQLNRPLAPEQARRSAAAKIWQYLLAALLLSTEASAQTSEKGKFAVLTTQRQDSRPSEDTTVKPAPPTGILRGQIRDTAGRPVPFATVSYDQHHAVAADDNGRFAISRSFPVGVTALTVSAVGYETTQVPLSAWAGVQEKVFTVQAAMMGGMVAVTKTHRRRLPVTSLIKDTLACIGLARNALTVYPNPAARGTSVTLALRLDMTGTYTAQLFSLSGVLVETVQIEADTKSKNVVMMIPAGLSAGAYFIRLSNPTMQKVYTQQVLVL